MKHIEWRELGAGDMLYCRYTHKWWLLLNVKTLKVRRSNLGDYPYAMFTWLTDIGVRETQEMLSRFINSNVFCVMMRESFFS